MNGRMEDRLREALTAAVRDVDPAPDALPRIRQRTAVRSVRRSVGRWLPLGAAAMAATAAVVAAVVSCVPDRDPAPLPLGTADSALPTPVPSRSASPTPQSGTLVASVPVYYAHGGRLFREYHELTVTPDTVEGRVSAAVTEMLRDRSAADADYSTLWPAGLRVLGVRITGGVVTVDLSGVGAAPRGPAVLAAQQLVWTVAAAVASTPAGPVGGVRLLAGGAPLGTLWGAVDAAAPLTQAAQVDVLAPVWLIEPHQGATVGRTFTVHLAGTVFEATLQLRVRSADKIVKEQTVTLDRGAPARGEARLQLTLPPGRYRVEAFFLSAKDGTVQGLDDHDILVR